MFGSFYQGKKVLVTGHTGFKGGWLSFWLSQLGAKVGGFALSPSTDPSFYEAVGLSSFMDHETLEDLRSSDSILHCLETFQPEIIFHLAAQPLVKKSYHSPKDTFDINVGGTINLLEGIRKIPSVQTALFISSDKCYENMEQIWGYREKDPMGGSDPYSASKGAMEIVIDSYRRSFFSSLRGNLQIGRNVGIASARAGNVIGGGDWANDRIVPDSVISLSQDRAIAVRNPNSIRPWQHVLECLSGYLSLGAKLGKKPHLFESAWNFGPQTSRFYPVRNLVEMILASWGRGSWQDLSLNQSPSVHEAKILKLNCDKASSLLFWYPVLEMERAVNMTIGWYKKYYESPTPEKMQEISSQQISQYTELAKEKNLSWTI